MGDLNPSSVELLATILFGLAITHTFLVSKFEHLAHKYPHGSVGENLFHFLGEVEVVFGIWAGVFIIALSFMDGFMNSIKYLESLNYTEPAFVFVIMCMAGTRPMIKLAEKLIVLLSKIFPLPGKMGFYCAALIFGPLLGSLITEPAAMTLTAIILLKNFYEKDMDIKFKYATIGLLFVNVSIGGTLTHFAAPPVLMVAGKWGWGISHMINNFGYKAVVGIIIATIGTAFYFKKQLTGAFELQNDDDGKMNPKWWITTLHIIFLALVVITAHHPVFFMGLFLFFLGFTTVTDEYQDRITLKESLLVGFFLAGLVTLGSLQAWWLKPILTQLGAITLFIGSTALTAITDNAALTYLGSLVELGDEAKYYLVAGAVSGGGLTVIANAPNPAGFGILKGSFGEDGINPMKLLLSALLPTLIAMACFHFLPSL